MRSDLSGRARGVVLAVAIVSMSCQSQAPAPPAQATPPAGPTGTLTVAVTDLGTERFIPRLGAGGDKPQLMAFGETLVRLDNQSRKLLPGLATSWALENRAGKWIWNFKLRSGIQFNEDQGPVTADDVKFTFAECLKKDTLNSTCPVLVSAIGGDIGNFNVVSPSEFELSSGRAVADLPFFVSNGAGSPIPILPKAYYEKVGDAGFTQHPIGAGPFIVKSLVSGQEMVFEAVANHYRKTAFVKEVRLRIIPDPSTRIALLKSGEADFAPVDLSLKKELESAKLKSFGVKDIGNASVMLGGQYYDLPAKNCTSCPWVGESDRALKVRQALSLAIDRKAILDNLLGGEGRLGSAPFSWVPGPYDWNDPAWAAAAYDPAKSRQLLADAGYPSGFKIGMAIFSLFQLPELTTVDELVATYWEKIGITVERQPTTFTPAFRTKLQNRDTAGVAFGTVMVIPSNPLADMPRLFSKAGSLAYLHDSVIDKAIADSANVSDYAGQMAAARKVGKEITDRQLGIPLFSVNRLFGATDRLADWEFLSGEFNLNNLEYAKLKR